MGVRYDLSPKRSDGYTVLDPSEQSGQIQPDQSDPAEAPSKTRKQHPKVALPRRLNSLGICFALAMTGNTVPGAMDAGEMIADWTPRAVAVTGDFATDAGGFTMDVGRSLWGFFVTEAGASELSQMTCPYGPVRSFTQSDLSAGGYTESQAESYYRGLGYEVVKVNNGWTLTCKEQSTPETSPPATAAPATPPPATAVPTTTNQPPKRPAAKNPEQTSATVVATTRPTTTTSTTTTTAPPPEIILNGALGSGDSTVEAEDSSVGDFFDGGKTESSGQPSDPTREDQPISTPPPESPGPRPTNDQPVDVAVLPIASSKDEKQARQALDSGSPDIIMEPRDPQPAAVSTSFTQTPEQSSQLEAERARSDLTGRLRFLQAGVENGSISIDQLTEQVMPPGMQDQAWCLGLITKQLTDMGFDVNRPGTNAQETGVLNFYRMLQSGPITSQDGQKTLSLIDAKDSIGNPLLAGDIMLFERQGEGFGHASTVAEDYDPMLGGFVKGYDGNWGNSLTLTSRKLTSDMGGSGTLTKFLGVARISGSGASNDPLQTTPTANESGQQIIVTVHQKTLEGAAAAEDNRSLAEQAAALVPDPIVDLYETATGTSISPPTESEPHETGSQETQVVVNVDPNGQITTPAAKSETTPNPATDPLAGSVIGGEPEQTTSTDQISDLPPDARDMTEAQAQVMFKKLEGLEYKRTTSIEEFVTYYHDLWYVASYLSGVPADIIAAHSSIEAGQSQDGGERQEKGWPSGSFEQDLNSHGIKTSPTKGCRISQTGATSAEWDTNEGTPGVDQYVEEGAGFCRYDNFLLTAISYANLLKDVYGVNRDNPVDTEGYIRQLQGKWMTIDTWPKTIRQRLEMIRPWMQKG